MKPIHPLRRWRFEHDQTRTQLAETLNITAEAIRRWEHYQNTPNRTQMLKIRELTGLSADDFYPKTDQTAA